MDISNQDGVYYLLSLYILFYPNEHLYIYNLVEQIFAYFSLIDIYLLILLMI